MKKSLIFVISILVIAALVLTGCAQTQKAVETAAKDAGATVQDAAKDVADTAKDAASTVADAAKDAASTAADAVKDAASTVANAVKGDKSVCEGEGGCAVVKPGETIKLGVAGPITGEYSMYGLDISDSEKISVADLEPLEGFKWELLAEDTVGSPEAAVAIANKWIADKSFAAVAGLVFTGESAAVIPIMEKNYIPMMSPSATGANLTEGNSVFNRIVFQDAAQGKFAAEFIVNTLGLKKVAILHDGLDYGKGIADTVRDTLVAMGVEPVAYEALVPGEADYSSILAAIASKNPEIIYYGGYTAELSVIANQRAQVGMSNVPVFSDDGAFGVEFLEKAGKNAEGCYGTSSVPADTPEKTAFDKKYEETYGRVAGSKSTFPWFSYDVVQVLAADIRQVAFVGDDGNLYIPRAELVKTVRGTKGFMGLTGEITCSEDGECNASGPTFYIVKDGKWIPASPAK